ncbi:MAG: efflux RND transporter periplasmic adaptor subunit [Legionellales bacterium]|nr:efflux RND transporter periplasmic adaptor subunit [Legionellales bacterium]
MIKKILFFLLSSFILMACQKEKTVIPSVLVKTAPMEQRNLSETIEGYGSVGVSSSQILTISLPSGGQVKSLFVAAGQKIKRGENLAVILTDPSSYFAYQQAVNALASNNKALKQVQELFDAKLATRAQLAAAQQAQLDAQSDLNSQIQKGANQIEQHINAPFDGIILTLNAAVGDRLAAGAPIFSISKFSAISVQLSIDPAESVFIQPHMPVLLTPLNLNVPGLTGEVGKVYGIIDPATQGVNVWVKLKKENNKVLLPGTAVEGRIIIQSQKMWTVPRSAVLKDKWGYYIFQVKLKKAYRVNVKMILADKDYIGISGSFATNSPVVIEGNYELDNEMAVRE